MLDILVVGGGPAGLSCAIEAMKSGLAGSVLEKGSIVDAIRRFPANLVWFSTPELLEIGGIPFVTSTFRPTRVDAIKYYQKVISHYGIDVRQFDSVRSVEKRGNGFLVSTEKGLNYETENVVVATGYYDHPNRLDIPGEDLPYVKHYYEEPYAFFNRRVAIIGGRNSAVEAALELFRYGSRVTLIHRGSRLSDGVKYWILPDIENRIKAKEIEAFFDARVKKIWPDRVSVVQGEDSFDIEADAIFILIGFHPDPGFLEGMGVRIDQKTLSPFHDPGTMETNVPGLFVAGSVVAGMDNNKIFIENGRLHGPQIIRAILEKRGENS
jgi:thioredoxin reductase (NADPH)